MNEPARTHDDIAAEAARLLDGVRASRPLVQVITNLVSMDIAANVLLAAGAAPAMVHAPQESPEFIRKVAALVINTGTLTQAGAEAMEVATIAARTHGVPWVLDPVGVGGTKFRDETILRLLRHRPAIIRGNSSEIIALARIAGLTQEAGGPRGMDNVHSADEAEASARKLARHCLCTVAATGAIDLITDGQRLVRLANGSPLMERVTALGCALSAYSGAFLGLGADPFSASCSALSAYAIAGDMAAEGAKGPASFRTAFIDILFTLSGEDIVQRLRRG